MGFQRRNTIKQMEHSNKMDDKMTGLIAGLLIGLIAGAGVMFVLNPAAGPAQYTITSSGSTTVLPLSTEWSSQIGTYYPTFTFSATGGGSGQGQEDSALGLVDIGASSSYPKEDWRTANPDMHILPVALDALAVVANPAVNTSGLKMDCDMVVAIYNGNVTTWEEFETTFAVEVDATGDIVVYGRSDASGTTATFAKWLETSDDTTNPNANYVWGHGHDEALAWPSHVQAVDGNPGVASAIGGDEASIGYVGFAFIGDLEPIWLYNPELDEYIEPTVANALKALPTEITDPGVNLFNSDQAGAYPIARLLFYLVNPTGLKWYTIAFLNWALTTGQQFVPDVGYVPITGTSAGSFAISVVQGMTPGV
ncbi:MAG: hypothetical protein GF411_03945 [Candidatus Lokiarchaeota archaeon]|nr:hypothetical protein [Candidatus Lokiarchaeota archaeon]